MINLEIIASSNSDEIGNYPYEFDCIYIGNSKRADIQINDKRIPSKYLTIKCILNQLIIKNETLSPFYFVNGKKISGARKLKRGDIITIESLQIKIIDFDKTEKDENLEQYHQSLDKNANELRFLLDILEEKILEIEGKNIDV